MKKILILAIFVTFFGSATPVFLQEMKTTADISNNEIVLKAYQKTLETKHKSVEKKKTSFLQDTKKNGSDTNRITTLYESEKRLLQTTEILSSIISIKPSVLVYDGAVFARFLKSAKWNKLAVDSETNYVYLQKFISEIGQLNKAKVFYKFVGEEIEKQKTLLRFEIKYISAQNEFTETVWIDKEKKHMAKSQRDSKTTNNQIVPPEERTDIIETEYDYEAEFTIKAPDPKDIMKDKDKNKRQIQYVPIL